MKERKDFAQKQASSCCSKKSSAKSFQLTSSIPTSAKIESLCLNSLFLLSFTIFVSGFDIGEFQYTLKENLSLEPKKFNLKSIITSPPSITSSKDFFIIGNAKEKGGLVIIKEGL